MSLHIILGDKNPSLIAAWEDAFRGVENVEPRGGNILFARADALVSPANSFGFMDGGLDWSISEMLEWKIQSVVQNAINRKHDGELLVGHAEIVQTGNERFPYLVCAPTMRVPTDVSQSVNAYLAFRAVLIAIGRFNKEHSSSGSSECIKSVAVPGLCTGIGRMPHDRCARQMREAYDQVLGDGWKHYGTLEDAIVEEKSMIFGKED